MPSVVLHRFSNPKSISNKSVFKTIKPVSYLEWLAVNVGIIPDQSHSQYEQYLAKWYSENRDDNDLTLYAQKIKDDYISLLKRLQIIFKNDENFARISNIDFDSSVELQIAIPAFSRKLKEIALYYVQQRETIRKLKIQYNLVGSNNALTKILYTNLLDAFSKKEENVFISSQEIYNAVPALSVINSDFQVEIEELYDTTNYFDREHLSNEVGVYDLVTDNPLLFVLSDYIDGAFGALSMDEVPLSGFSNPLAPYIACETDLSLSIQTQALINSKYVGNNIYYLTGGYFDWDVRNMSLDMVPGNNFFYWFSGQQVKYITEGTFLPVAITDWAYTNATGAPTIDNADIVFMSVGNIGTEGAWLKSSNKITVDTVMRATMLDNKLFRFAYPGKGTITDDSVWTGKQLTDVINEPRTFFPSESISNVDLEKQVETLYWTKTPSISTVQSMFLQDTSLVESGAYASTLFKKADKIILYPESSNISFTPVLYSDLEIAWLYDFRQTNIAVTVGINNIYYPLTAYYDIDQLFFRYESGDAISLSALDVNSSFTGAVAGDSLENSDLLLKLATHCGPVVEVAWLNGAPLTKCNPCLDTICECRDGYQNYYTKWLITGGVTQPGLSFKCDDGEYIRFIWSGETTKINNLRGFLGFAHDANCEYLRENLSQSILDINFLDRDNDAQYEKWKKCTCKAIHHSPMGHAGSKLLDYRLATDFIVKDTAFPADFNAATWRGLDGLKYNDSSDAAWFKTTNLLEKDVGWGQGLWQKSSDGTDFYLESGQSYIYYRSNLTMCDFTLPYFIINQCYTSCCGKGSCTPIWMKAVADSNNEYLNTGVISDMTLESGFFYTYIHRSASSFTKTILQYDGKQVVPDEYVRLAVDDPLISYAVQTIEVPAINFALKIPLVNNSPYWGVASYKNNSNTKNKKIMRGADEFHIVHEYVQIRQPHYSGMKLTDDATIQYQLSECNECFVWNQDIKIDVAVQNQQWCKIIFGDCMISDILHYLHSRCTDRCDDLIAGCYSECVEDNICGCSYSCFSTKTGVTATDIPSDMMFNTELSGIPVYVNYFARNNTNISFDIVDVSQGYPPTGGKWIPPVSAVFVDATEPWKNIINDFYSVVAAVPVDDELSSAKELGMFIPSRLETGKYELHNAERNLSPDLNSLQPLRLFREDNYKDDVFSIDNVNSNWMKHKQGQNILGHIKVDNNQTFHPYNTDFQINHTNSYGMNNTTLKTSPWTNDGKWIDKIKFPANLSGIYPIDCGADSWYNSQYNLSGNVIEWQSDMFGNQYFLMNFIGTRLSLSSSYNSFYVKNNNGEIVKGTEYLDVVVEKYKNISG